jgi:hypothetical protein
MPASLRVPALVRATDIITLSLYCTVYIFLLDLQPCEFFSLELYSRPCRVPQVTSPNVGVCVLIMSSRLLRNGKLPVRTWTCTRYMMYRYDLLS